MISLVGYTGFVGGNLAASGKIDGLNGSFNLDYAYLKFPEIMKNNHLNGF